MNIRRSVGSLWSNEYSSRVCLLLRLANCLLAVCRPDQVDSAPTDGIQTAAVVDRWRAPKRDLSLQMKRKYCQNLRSRQIDAYIFKLYGSIVGK